MTSGAAIRTLCCALFAAALPLIAQSQPFQIDGVPLPADVQTAPPETSPFAGAWVGAWGNTLKHILVVEDIKPDQSASVVYAYGDAVSWGITKDFHRYNATLSDNTLTMAGSGFTATYLKLPSGKLIATFRPQHGLALAVMHPVALDDLRRAQTVRWSEGSSQMLDTALSENGTPTQLEVVTFKPDGPGPFPLAVVNHGSTGDGRNPHIAKLTFVDLGIATFLTDRGYLVAFPQRRGRGKSDGLYDEGFRKERAKGYSCDTKTSLRGADRALTDLSAAITALQNRVDVAKGPTLLSGISRGGILSLAYAGQNPDQISGVINFVGGWMGDRCPNAEAINGTLFTKAAAYPGQTLWLYGDHDPFYSLAHIAKGYAAFTKSGGTGTFHSFNVAGGNGHALSADWNAWFEPATAYLNHLKAQ